MTATELRQKYLDFFRSKNHSVIRSASLLPENDATVLFTTAGMQPLVPYLLGEKHPGGARLASAQKCVRTDDIDEVGDETHHTFFEMMGNWSLGDYFKDESIAWSWELLTSPKWLNLDPKLLAVSVFEGDKDAPFDEESYNLWLSLGMPAEKIAKLPKKNNWWGPAGTTGPCGPDTEIFYWSGNPDEVPNSFNDDNDKWVEIWNNVFMQYNKQADGSFELLKQQNVDTGLGLERVTAVLNHCDNYQTDLFKNIISKIEELSGKKYNDSNETRKAMRVIADHVKAATMIIGDEKGVAPSNTDQGYIVRRLLRRVMRFARQLEINQTSWLKELAMVVINDYEKIYPELRANENFVYSELDKEEEKFSRTLEKGLLEFNKLTGVSIDGVSAFNLYQSYGFPFEITEELAKEKGMTVDKNGFDLELEKHQELSRTASAGKFKGGLADNSEETTKLHTAAHLLLAALRRVLGEGVTQKGSNITAERLRFDFSYPEKMTSEQVVETERLVNEAIANKLDVVCEEMGLEEAKKVGAMGVFDSKYGEKVKVYTTFGYFDVFVLNDVNFKDNLDSIIIKLNRITTNSIEDIEVFCDDERVDDGYSLISSDEILIKFKNKAVVSGKDIIVKIRVSSDSQHRNYMIEIDNASKIHADKVSYGSFPKKSEAFSREICGGPHVKNTGELGHFRIQKEESSSSGVRRIKAILEQVDKIITI
ncbi:MAG: alanine--tRNA ligase [Patescibacteria group bacterium]